MIDCCSDNESKIGIGLPKYSDDDCHGCDEDAKATNPAAANKA